MKITWDPGAASAQNMAADTELMRRAESGEASARLYTWETPWVTLGKFQRAETALLPACPIGHTIRPTGGKAVLHGHDLTVTLAIPLALIGLPDGSRELKRAYRAVTEPLIAGLNEGGVSAALAEQTKFVRSRGKVADCFAHISPNDIVDPQTGQKVCGCALQMTQKAILVQSSIPLGPPLVDPRDVYDEPSLGRKTPVALEPLVESLTTALGSF